MPSLLAIIGVRSAVFNNPRTLEAYATIAQASCLRAPAAHRSSRWWRGFLFWLSDDRPCDYLLLVIRDHIAVAASIDAEDFDYAPFVKRCGLGKAHELFGEQCPALQDEVNQVLAA